MRWVALAALMVAFALAGPAAGQGAPEITATELLAQCPCEPLDKERFATNVYPTGLTMVPAPDPGFNQEQCVADVTARLEGRLQQRSASERQRALAVFDEASAETDVRLAAGLAMLVGTVGEPAIPVVLDENVFEDGVGFANAAIFEQRGLTNALAAVVRQDGRFRIIFQERLQHEDFVLFAPVLAHEALHQDILVGRPERELPTAGKLRGGGVPEETSGHR